MRINLIDWVIKYFLSAYYVCPIVFVFEDKVMDKAKLGNILCPSLSLHFREWLKK